MASATGAQTETLLHPTQEGPANERSPSMPTRRSRITPTLLATAILLA
jgi:hypothetical protein